MLEKIKRFYDLGLWTEEMVMNAVDKGVITEGEYKNIILSDTEEGDS